MVLLAAIPASVTITNVASEDLVVAGVRFPAAGGGTVVVPLDGRGDGNKSDVWQALYEAQEAGLLTSDPVLTALEDPIASGHTLSGGQDALGAVS